MIQTIGLIVLVYAIARLIQVPLESCEKEIYLGRWPVKWPAICVVSNAAVLALVGLGLLLLLSGFKSALPQ